MNDLTYKLVEQAAFGDALLYISEHPLCSKEDVVDDVHPDTFGEALDNWPDVAAMELSEAVYDGIERAIRSVEILSGEL